ncbi:MAG: lamin tail domain-containing protein, partial [Caldilineales bacterium]|nr:lamin tail domain-containing protein [Caldilineales bacterium]
GISLNEFMPDPGSDWDGDGTANAQDEYIELYNANDFPVDLGGWKLDDVDDSAQRTFFMPEGSPVFTIPAGTVIAPRGFVVFYRSQTRIALNNEGDWVRLLRPDGTVVEAVEYPGSRKDQAHSKTVDGGTQWTRDYPPSPGAPNRPAPTPTPTPPGPLPSGVGLNEFMPRPASDWNGDGAANPQDEYIELFNAGDQPVDLGGWMLDDEPEAAAAAGAAPEGTRPYVIPAGTVIPARGFLVFYRSQTGVTLNDDGDSARLLAPDGREVERYDYPSARPDTSYSKTEDGGNVWTTAYPPSPAAPNRPAYTSADVVRLNEVLPAPRDGDWDGDGQADYRDEWIELVNAGETTVDLGGWQLTDSPPPDLAAPAAPAGRTYTLPRGLRLAPGEYLVVYRRDSGLALDAKDEWVRLLYPDGVEADRLFYDRFPGYDQAWCRIPDGRGQWSTACVETPGRPNVPDASGGGGDGSGGGSPGGGSAAPYDRFNFDLIPIAAARALPDGTRATLEGQVTVLPNVLDDREIYIQDATGGMRVYLRSAEWPPLSEGQWVRVNGRLDTFDGERVIRLVRIDDIKTLAPAPPPFPLPIRTGDVGEATEGRLVTITAPVRGFRGQSSLILDDGSGEAWVVVLRSTGMRRPYVVIGDVWTAVGVVSQDDREPPYDGYHRVLPRRPADLVRGAVDWALLNSPPLFLPVTGAADQMPPPSVP